MLIKADSHTVAAAFASSGSNRMENPKPQIHSALLFSRHSKWWDATGCRSLSSGSCIWSTSWALRTSCQFRLNLGNRPCSCHLPLCSGPYGSSRSHHWQRRITAPWGALFLGCLHPLCWCHHVAQALSPMVSEANWCSWAGRCTASNFLSCMRLQGRARWGLALICKNRHWIQPARPGAAAHPKHTLARSQSFKRAAVVQPKQFQKISGLVCLPAQDGEAPRLVVSKLVSSLDETAGAPSGFACGSQGSAAAAEAASGGFAEPMLRKKAALVNYKQMEFR